jgi:transmembrane sensor
LQFDRMPLAEVLRILQRYHDRPSCWTTRYWGRCRCRAFDADRAETVLALLPEILPVQVHTAAMAACICAPRLNATPRVGCASSHPAGA